MTDAKDPVCGMTVNKQDSKFISSFKGVKYYFCAKRCKADFDDDPETVLAMESARGKIIEKERSVSLEKMIDAVAHEIRNPLTSIGGFARKIYKSLPYGDTNKQYLKMIIDDVARVENMIGQIAELRTMGMSHQEPSDINSVICDSVESFENELKSNRVELDLELMDIAPLVPLDSKRLKIAITHLIRNALEAMEQKPGLLRISSLIESEHISITVSDTGKGIAEDKIKYVFDPLFTSKIYGPGLGLTLVNMIVQEHGGDISVESAQGRGAAFTINLPLKR